MTILCKESGMNTRRRVIIQFALRTKSLKEGGLPKRGPRRRRAMTVLLPCILVTVFMDFGLVILVKLRCTNCKNTVYLFIKIDRLKGAYKARKNHMFHLQDCG